MIENFYKTSGFHSLKLDIRVDLLPVIEGVKKGSIIIYEDSLWRFLKSAARRAELQYEKQRDWVFIFKDREHYEKYLAGRINLGAFLDYPECCVKKYENSGVGKSERSWREAAKAIKNGTYHDVFEYALHIPCSMSCEKTLETCRLLREVFEKHDKLAGTYLKLRERGNIKKYLK